MKRREFMTLLAGAAAGSSAFCSVTWPLAVRAQQPTAPALGFPNKTLRIIERARHLGAYLQATQTAEERARSQRHSIPEAVLAETAVLDFLRE